MRELVGLVFLSLVMSCRTQIVPGPVVDLNFCTDGTPPIPPFDFEPAGYTGDGFVERCTGNIIYKFVNVGDYPVCGPPNEELVQRICFDTGVSTDSTHSRVLFKCSPLVGAGFVNDQIYYGLSGATFDLRPQSCPNFLCTATCISQLLGRFPPALFSYTGSELTAEACGGTMPSGIMAISCTDRDECTEGALVLCITGLEDECLTVPACADNAYCENTVGGYICECDEGYIADNNDEKYGPSGKGCRAGKCGLPPSDGNAYHNATSGGEGVEIEYVCLVGFAYNGRFSYSRVCEDGQWSNLEARCEDIDECYTSASTCDEDALCINTPGSHICLCKGGYAGEGDNCEPLDCSSPLVFSNAVQVRTSYYSHASEVDYRCNKGYRVFYPPYWTPGGHSQNSRSDERFSLYCENGVWQPQPIVDCVRVDCGDPGTKRHATRTGSSFKYKQSVTYTCDPGFKSSPGGRSSFQITCTSDGTWSSSAQCLDVSECANNPCDTGGTGLHHCIERPGTFTCSCASGYRLDPRGQACIQEEVEEEEENQCSVFKRLGLCHEGECYIGLDKKPTCRCGYGYTGAFCDRRSRMDHIAVAALVLACLSTFILLVLLFCTCCCRHNYRFYPHPPPYPPPHPPPCPPRYPPPAFDPVYKCSQQPTFPRRPFFSRHY